MGDELTEIRFGSSGIRGPVEHTITPELVMRLGAAVTELTDDLVVARDARTTGSLLERALIAGATSRGARVTRLGLAPTPTLAYAAREHGLGIMLTASHNPPPDNGIKLFEPDGSALGPKGRESLLDRLEAPPPPVAWDAVGPYLDDAQATEAHLAALLDRLPALEGAPRLVLDLGNGAACGVTPALLRQAGARLTTLNAQPDGTFPGRPSEPTPQTLTELSRTVVATDAACGLAHDGDGDRLVAIDETGRALSGDQLIALIGQHLGIRRLAVPVNTSQLVWEALPEAEITTTPVGDAYVSEALAEQARKSAPDGPAFGGEPSGCFIFPGLSLCPDGPHAALIVAAIAAEHGGLADLVDQLPSYETRRASLELSPGTSKPAIMEGVIRQLEAMGQLTTLDGARLDTEAGWLLVRPSGTEPKIRVTAEAPDALAADRLLEQGLSTVRAALEA